MDSPQRLTPTTLSRERQSEGDMRLFGRQLVSAQVAWGVVVVLAVAVFLASLPVYFLQNQTICTAGAACSPQQLTPGSAQALEQLHLPFSLYATFRLLLAVVTTVVYFSVAAVIVWRKSTNWMVLLVALLLVIQGVFNTSNALELIPSAWQFPAQCVDYLNYVLLFLVFCLFPNGHFVPRWSRWLVVGMALNMVATFFPNLFVSSVLLLDLNQVIIIGLLLGLIVAQLYRYRHNSRQVERQQTKWVVFSVVVVTLLEIGLSVPYLLFPLVSQQGSLYNLFDATFGFFLPILIPLAFGVAILRYRLWDIDLIINRTLVYSLLTVTLALLYMGLVFALQSLLRSIINQNSDIAIVVSTLAIAAVFQPLRHRIQSTIDLRFYRRKYDAARMLAAFSATLRQEVDLSKLSEQLVAVVQETMQPTHISLWLRAPEPARERNTRLLPRIDEEESNVL